MQLIELFWERVTVQRAGQGSFWEPVVEEAQPPLRTPKVHSLQIRRDEKVNGCAEPPAVELQDEYKCFISSISRTPRGFYREATTKKLEARHDTHAARFFCCMNSCRFEIRPKHGLPSKFSPDQNTSQDSADRRGGGRRRDYTSLAGVCLQTPGTC